MIPLVVVPRFLRKGHLASSILKRKARLSVWLVLRFGSCVGEVSMGRLVKYYVEVLLVSGVQ